MARSAHDPTAVLDGSRAALRPGSESRAHSSHRRAGPEHGSPSRPPRARPGPRSRAGLTSRRCARLEGRGVGPTAATARGPALDRPGGKSRGLEGSRADGRDPAAALDSEGPAHGLTAPRRGPRAQRAEAGPESGGAATSLEEAQGFMRGLLRRKCQPAGQVVIGCLLLAFVGEFGPQLRRYDEVISVA